MAMADARGPQSHGVPELRGSFCHAQVDAGDRGVPRHVHAARRRDNRDRRAARHGRRPVHVVFFPAMGHHIYTLTLAALLLGMGSVADLRGRRRLYIAGLSVFAVASLGSGLAPSPALLIAARGLQGIGGAAMYATTIALLSSSYHGRDRGTAFGIWGAVSGAAAAAGPIPGGLLTERLSWRGVRSEE